MKVTEVDSIANDSEKVRDPDDLSRLVELPLLESCKIFLSLGVKTIMSGCNKRNVFNKDIPRRKNVTFADGITRDWSFSNGYGWIMIDFLTLSPVNQEFVLSLCDENNFSLVEELSENARRAFLDLCALNGTTPSNKELVELVTIPKVSGTLPQQLILHYENIEATNPKLDNPRFVEFYQKKHTLFVTPYISYGVILKYPLNEETTVEEVNDYFVELANKFANQKGFGFRVIK